MVNTEYARFVDLPKCFGWVFCADCDAFGYRHTRFRCSRPDPLHKSGRGIYSMTSTIARTLCISPLCGSFYDGGRGKWVGMWVGGGWAIGSSRAGVNRFCFSTWAGESSRWFQRGGNSIFPFFFLVCTAVSLALSGRCFFFVTGRCGCIVTSYIIVLRDAVVLRAGKNKITRGCSQNTHTHT